MGQTQIEVSSIPNFPFRPKVENASQVGVFGDRVLSVTNSISFVQFKQSKKFGYRIGLIGGTLDYTYHSILNLNNGYRYDSSDLPENLSYLGLNAAAIYRKRLLQNKELEFTFGVEKRLYRYGNELDTIGLLIGSKIDINDRVGYRITSNRANDQFQLDFPSTVSIRQFISKRSAFTTGLAANFGVSAVKKGVLYIDDHGENYSGSFQVRSSYIGLDLRYSYQLRKERNKFEKGAHDTLDFKKSIFIELLGSGVFYSINYDIRLERNTNKGFGLRFGIGKGTYNSNETFGSRYTSIPLNVNYIVGRKRSGIEAGISFTPEFTFRDYDPKANFYTIANVGYRYQPMNSGLLARVNYTPLLIGKGISTFYGVSLGYGFW